MKLHTSIMSAFTLAILAVPVLAINLSAVEGVGGCAQAKNPKKCEALGRNLIYGGHLMTKKERAEYREKIMKIKTIEERDAFRAQHHESMLERARMRGLKLAE